MPCGCFENSAALRLTRNSWSITGEAARLISEPLKIAHPEIPWRAIIAQRHVLAHEYGKIDPEKIYRVVTIHIPELLKLLRPLLPPLDQQTPGPDNPAGAP